MPLRASARFRRRVWRSRAAASGLSGVGDCASTTSCGVGGPAAGARAGGAAGGIRGASAGGFLAIARARDVAASMALIAAARTMND